MRALLCAAPPLGGSPIALFFLSCHPPAAVVITVPLVTPLGERKWINRNVCHSEDERRPAANGSAVMRQVTISFPQPGLTSRWLFKEEISHLLGPRLHFSKGSFPLNSRRRRAAAAVIWGPRSPSKPAVAIEVSPRRGVSTAVITGGQGGGRRPFLSAFSASPGQETRWRRNANRGAGLPGPCEEEERQIPETFGKIESVVKECSQTHPAKTSGAAKTLGFKLVYRDPRPTHGRATRWKKPGSLTSWSTTPGEWEMKEFCFPN
ncbi:hypothetical protein CapIbe_003802 [Capra ibex]